MNSTLSPGIRMIGHQGVNIIELRFGGKNFEESAALIGDYAFLLEALRKNGKARVLVDLENAYADLRLGLAWKARLKLFNARVGCSAIIGASGLAKSGLHGLAEAARLLNLPLGSSRAVLFQDRAAALDWLALKPSERER